MAMRPRWPSLRIYGARRLRVLAGGWGVLGIAGRLQLAGVYAQVFAVIVKIWQAGRQRAADALVEAAGGRIVGTAAGPNDDQPPAGGPNRRLHSLKERAGHPASLGGRRGDDPIQIGGAA